MTEKNAKRQQWPSTDGLAGSEEKKTGIGFA